MPPALDFSTPHLIRNVAEYDTVVAEMMRLLDIHPPEGSPEAEQIEFFTVLVEDYDRKHHELPGGPVSAREVVVFMLDQRGMRRADLTRGDGRLQRAGQRRFFPWTNRPLSVTQVPQPRRALLGIPARSLLLARPVARRPAGLGRRRIGRRP